MANKNINRGADQLCSPRRAANPRLSALLLESFLPSLYAHHKPWKDI